MSCTILHRRETTETNRAASIKNIAEQAVKQLEELLKVTAEQESTDKFAEGRGNKRK